MDIQNHNQAINRRLLYGAALWVFFCIIAVLLRGIRWDETYEHAQILAGQVPYPEDHPLRLYVHNAFSIQPFLSAGMLLGGAGPLLVCGLRNALFLIATLLPVYLITAHATGRTRWGHAAAALLLQGILLEFDGSYPTVVWPELYSNGPIGGAFALITVWALLANHLRTAGLLFGLLPCIHLGQWPPVLILFTIFALFELYQRNFARIRPLALYTALGLLISLLLFLTQRFFFQESLPAASENDLWAIWKGYTFHFDPHRQFPPANGQILLCGTLLLSGAAAWRKPACRRLYLGLFLYSAGIALCVWGIMHVQTILGENTPFLLVSWMPYRLINHLPPLCLAILISILAPRHTLWIIAALLFATFHPWIQPLIGASLYTRYLSGGECVVFGLYGAALWTLLVSYESPKQIPTLPVQALIVTLCLTLGIYHQFGAFCIILGMLGTILINHGPKAQALSPIVMASASLLALIAAVCIQIQFRQELPVPSFDQQLRTTLTDEPNAMLVGPPDTLLLQAHTGHPVLAETATPSLISYVPALGPEINRLYEDLYGISFLNPTSSYTSWDQIWSERTLQEWQTLSNQYKFHYVISLPSIKLQLPILFDTAGATLYQIPE